MQELVMVAELSAMMSALFCVAQVHFRIMVVIRHENMTQDKNKIPWGLLRWCVHC